MLDTQLFWLLAVNCQSLGGCANLCFCSCVCIVLQVMTAPIRAFVDMIINMIVGWYLWPSRLTVSALGGVTSVCGYV
jgi:hypothetical protein